MTTTIALITGANKGIGLETARQLGARGVTVLAGARDEARRDEQPLAWRAPGEGSCRHAIQRRQGLQVRLPFG